MSRTRSLADDLAQYERNEELKNKISYQNNIAMRALSEFHYVTFLQALLIIGKLQNQNRALGTEEVKPSIANFGPEQILALKIFSAVWNDVHAVKVRNDKEDISKGRRNTQYLAARKSLSREKQNLVDEGLSYFQPILDSKEAGSEKKQHAQDTKGQPAAVSKSVEGQPSATKLVKAKIKKGSPADFVKEKDKKAYEAIMGYKTPGQEVLDVIIKIVVRVTAFAFGALEAGTAIALLIPLLLPATLPVYAVYAITYLFTIPLAALATWMNWNVFEAPVSRQLSQFFGKNYLFDGVEKFVDTKDKKTGKERTLSPAKVRFVKAFALFAALPTGIAIGALGYTATLSVAQLPLLGGYVSAIGLGALLPGIGIAIAVVVAACMTCLFTDSITRLVQHNKDLWQAFKIKKPFADIRESLRKNNASIPTKIFSYGITLLLAAVGLIGLGMACFTSSRSIGIFLMNQFQTAPQIAETIGRIIAVPAFVSRAWWTFENMLKSGVAIVTRMIYSDNKKEAKTPNSSDAGKGKASKQSTAGITKDLLMGTLEAFEEGAFYGIAGMLAQQDSNLVIGAAAGTTAVRTWGTNIAALITPPADDAEERAKTQASIKRRKGIEIPKEFVVPPEFTARRMGR